MKNQVKKNLEKSDSSMDNDDNKYKCKKCKDVTYILTDKGAVPCSCKELREAERILSKSGISKEFANKTFDNFDYSRNVQILNAYNMAREYVKNFEGIKELNYSQYDFDLQLSGHAHGGQWIMPFIGPLFSPGQGVLPKYARGTFGERPKLIVSRGLGNSEFPLRLFNHPEIIVVNIEQNKG